MVKPRKSRYGAARGLSVMMAKGMKRDHGKDRWDLVPWDVMQDIVKVLTYGSKKYTPDNWKQVEPYRERYFAACLRHLSAWRNGELINKETKLPHIVHAITDLIFIAWKDKHAAKKGKAS